MKPRSLEIDVAGICAINHKCTGCKGQGKCCCSSYEITISSKELESIAGSISLAARFCPALKSEDLYENVFERVSSHLYAIDTNEKDFCVFAYLKNGSVACSLHAAAEKFGLPVSKIKPEVCRLWPLALSEGKSRILSVDDDAFEFGCNKCHPQEIWSLRPSIAAIVENIFGIEFRQDLQLAAEKGLRWTKIPLRAPRR